MHRTVWFGCLVMAGVLVAVHLVACREDLPAVLVSLGASLTVLHCLRRGGATGAPRRAAALALSPEAKSAGGDAGSHPGGDAGRPVTHRSAAALVLILLGGACALLTLGSGWLAFRAQARGTNRGAALPLEARP